MSKEQVVSPSEAPELDYSAFSITKIDVIRIWWKDMQAWKRLVLTAGAVLAIVGILFVHIVLIFYFIYLGGYTLQSFGHIRISKFATDNNLIYIEKLVGNWLVSNTVLSKQGRNHSSNQTLESKDDNNLPPFIAFTHSYEIGSGRGSQTISTAVLRLSLGKQTPHFLLDDIDNGKSGSFWSTGVGDLSVGHLEKLDLEGDFQEHFQLYKEKGSKDQVAILSILTPDFMQWLMSLDSAYDIEFVDEYIFVFSKAKTIADESVMRDMMRIAGDLFPRVDKAFAHYIPDA